MKHDYSVNGCERTGTYYVLAVVSISVGLGLIKLFKYIHLEIPWQLDFLSPSGLFVFFMWLQDNHAWKFLAKAGLFAPNFSGKWSGEIVAHFEGKKSRSSIEVEINQTWSKIQISARTSSGNTDSMMAVINKDIAELRYEFMNEPDLPTSYSPSHRGVGFLRLDKNKLHGGYYTQLAETTNGKLVLFRGRLEQE